MRISRRRAWIYAFILASLFWLTVAILAGLAIHAVQTNEQEERAAASEQAD